MTNKAREELIKELMKLTKPLHTGGKHELGLTMKRWELELVADYILNREQAIRDEFERSMNQMVDMHLDEEEKLKSKISEVRKVLKEYD